MKVALFKALPDDIIGVVWDMLDNDAKIMLNREFFFRYNYVCYNKMSIYNKYGYDRVMMRNDDSFIFKDVLDNNGKRWLSNKQYAYNNQIHKNYLYFLLCLIYENNSSRCNEIMNKFLNKEGLNKNLYKKYRNKNIRWSN